MGGVDQHATDEELAGAAADGDRRALDLLLRRHFDYIHTVCRRVLWRAEHADALEEARQEALLRTARGIGGYSGEARVTTWIHRIATNAALDALGRYGRRPVPAEPDEGAPAARADIARQVTQRAAIDDCLEGLAAPYRDAVVLCFLAELEYDEIARRLGVELGTVKSRIARGRSRLRECLEGQLEELA
jgi:RNA polymerase sigma-70 factor (ECF subfamily)